MADDYDKKCAKDQKNFFLNFLIQNFFGRFDTSGSMIPRLVPEIEGGYPERDGGEEGAEEGLVLEYSSSSWMRALLLEFRCATTNYDKVQLF